MRKIPRIYWDNLPGPEDITRIELPNGLIVLTRANFNSPSVSIGGYLNCGSLFDQTDKAGLAHFTALALTRGSQKHNFREIFDSLESVGASLGYGASVHTTSFGGRCLSEDLPLLMKLLSECLRSPVFPEEEIERLRAQILASLILRAQDTGDMASLIFDANVFPGHPYGQPEDGSTDTIRNITRQDLLDFHRKNYGPHGMVLVIVGSIPPNLAAEAAQTAFGDWKNPDQPVLPDVPPVRMPKKNIRRHVPIRGKAQTDLVMGSIGPKRSSDDYLPASLGNNILGQFGMMGRIGEVVREQAGLAYHASTSLNAWIAGGSWEVSAGVNPANLERAIEIIQSELVRFVNEPVADEELEDSQAHFLGRLPLSLESNAGVAGALLNLERFGLGLDYYRRYPHLVKSVTSAQILKTARRYINPEKLVIISAGSEEENPSHEI